jgi:hypothetical protein
MAEAQRKRWAAIKGESVPAKKVPAEKKPQRKLSAEGGKRIVAATKKRWAAIRAAAAAAAKELGETYGQLGAAPAARPDFAHIEPCGSLPQRGFQPDRRAYEIPTSIAGRKPPSP